MKYFVFRLKVDEIKINLVLKNFLLDYEIIINQKFEKKILNIKGSYFFVVLNFG